MSKVTNEQLETLENQYGDMYELPVGDKIAYLREPNMVDYKRAFSAMQRGTDIDFGEAMLDALFVAGDEDIKKVDDYFMPARKILIDFFNYDDAEVTPLKDGKYKIDIGEHSCVVRKITRDDLKLAEKKNPSGKPFVTQEKLFEIVCVEKDQAFNNRGDAKIRFPLFQAIEELQNQKVAILKKRLPMPS
ncbi:hypothetical protein [Pseudotamlana carrageenivorans]|nr:hypothetical protein [Tamlana carrageenivorans]